MELLFEDTNLFLNDLHQFSSADQKIIKHKINDNCQLLKTDEATFYQRAHQPYKIELTNGFSPSLYAVEVNPDIQVMMTVAEDPIFEKIIITLLGAAQNGDLLSSYKSLANLLYRDLIDSHLEEGHATNGTNKTSA